MPDIEGPFRLEAVRGFLAIFLWFLTDKKTRLMMVALYFLIIRQHIMLLVVQILSWDIRHLVDSNLVVMVNTMARIMMMATMVITRKMIWLIMHSIDILIIHQRRHINHNNKIIMEPKWFNIPPPQHLVAPRRIVLRVQKLRFFLNSLSKKHFLPFRWGFRIKMQHFSSATQNFSWFLGWCKCCIYIWLPILLLD